MDRQKANFLLHPREDGPNVIELLCLIELRPQRLEVLGEAGDVLGDCDLLVTAHEEEANEGDDEEVGRCTEGGNGEEWKGEGELDESHCVLHCCCFLSRI